MEENYKIVQLKRNETFGYGFSIFGGLGSGFPPVIYEIIEESPAAISGELEAGDIILEVNDRKVSTLTIKEVLKCVRLSNDVITLKVKKDSSIQDRVSRHMAASSSVEKAKRHKSKRCEDSVSSFVQSEHLDTNRDKEDVENIPPSPRHEHSQNDSDTDSVKSQTRLPQPRFETFMMTGDLIINLNARTSNSHFLLPSSNKVENISFNQCSSQTGPEQNLRIRNKSTKQDSSNLRSPVVDKKDTYNYSINFVRTSKSEGHLQNASMEAVDIDIEDDITTSVHTLLDTKQDNPANERIVWTYNAPVPHEQKSVPFLLENRAGSLIPTEIDLPINESDSKRTQLVHNHGMMELPSGERDRCSKNDLSEHLSQNSTSRLSANEDFVNGKAATDITSNNSMPPIAVDQISSPRTNQSKQDGITNIIVDENKIYVKVLPKQLEDNSQDRTSEAEDENQLCQKEYIEKASLSRTPSEDSNQNSSCEDESDIDSLHSYHYSPKAIDMPSAYRLAKRLYQLEGFKKSDVSRHLSKNNDFSQVVAEEYLKNFDFTGEKLDEALRKFLKQFCLIGETQERERVLVHFSQRYLDCNPEAFTSRDSVHTLTCALMLLNTDLHGENVGRKMSCAEFIDNLSSLNDGTDFPKEVLKTLYHSIKYSPLEWAICGEDGDDDDENTAPEGHMQAQDSRHTFIGHNPFLEVPNPNCATEYKKGYVMRKCCVDPNGKRTPLGKRGWKMFYATLRDLVLYLHKDENGFRKNQLYDSLHNSIRVHHALATKASNYTKKQHVFRLQTADQAEYLFQTGDSKELQSWIDTINYVAASLSALPLPGAVGSQKKFQRPLLPVTHTKFNLREQLQHHDSYILCLEKELKEHLCHAPEKTAKSRIINDFTEKEAYLQFELTRYKTYAYFLRSKMSQFPDLEPPLVETSIGEVDEPTEKSEQGSSPFHASVLLSSENSSSVKRSISDRYSYRAAIYNTTNGEDCI